MVQRRPDSMEALMTSTNPVRSKAVSPYTSSTRPQEMIATTPARCQLGLQGRTWLAGWALWLSPMTHTGVRLAAAKLHNCVLKPSKRKAVQAGACM